MIILGGGPNRIGQGIEFDYCCCHASFALREMGDRVGDGQLEPRDGQYRLRHQRSVVLRAVDGEDVLNICDRVQPDGVIVQFGGPNSAESGSGVGDRGRADYRNQCGHDRSGRGSRKVSTTLLERLGACKQPANGIARNDGRSAERCGEVGFPSLVRPSFVLGGASDGDLLRPRSSNGSSVSKPFIVAQGPTRVD